MHENRDRWLFAITLASAAMVLVSIAASETLLAMGCLSWLVFCYWHFQNSQNPVRMIWPSYVVPLVAFMATTALSLAMSPQPEVGMSSVRKFVLFSMGLLAANLVTTPARARIAHGVLLVVSAGASLMGIVQFAIAYIRFISTEHLADDPTVLSRITGFMGHWMTFSGEQLVIWCAAIPAMMALGRRWLLPMGLVGVALVLSFTRSVWLGAIAGFLTVAIKLPRKVLIGALLPVVLVGVSASGLIYHRVSLSFQQEKFAPDAGRLALFFSGVQMIRDHPLFGVGPERIHTEFPHYYRGRDLGQTGFYYGHLEDNVLQIAAERGLLCLAAFFWFIFELYASLLDMLKTGRDHIRWIVLSALSALTGFIVSGFFAYNFGDSEILLLLLFIVSAPYGVAAREPVEEPCPTNLIPTTI